MDDQEQLIDLSDFHSAVASLFPKGHRFNSISDTTLAPDPPRISPPPNQQFGRAGTRELLDDFHRSIANLFPGEYQNANNVEVERDQRLWVESLGESDSMFVGLGSNTFRTTPPLGLSSDLAPTWLPASLRHLDLTKFVSCDSTSMRAHGGFSDVFVGQVCSSYLQPVRSSHSQHRQELREGPVTVAIKRLRVRLGSDKKFAKTLAREMAIWAKLDHANILPFYGYVVENEYPSLVSEWMGNGTIKNYLQTNKCDFMQLALGIAKGIKYLHTQDIVHSDLKADNVLVSESGEPLICDFGISRMLDSSQSLFNSTTHGGDVKGSTRWMAIELLNAIDGKDPKHSKETDVWAYGMTLYEIMSNKLPYFALKTDASVIMAVVRGVLPSCPPSVEAQPSLLPLWSICRCCWKTNPSERLPIDQCVLGLEHDIQNRR